MVSLLLVAVLTAGQALAGGAPAAVPWAATPVCVVANVGDASSDVDLEFVRRVFLARQRFWPSGEAVHPVNLPAAAELRERFSQLVFGQSVTDMVPYWNERYFHGTKPPPTVASEAAVLLFVERTKGGVGYVSEPLTHDLPAGVRALLCLSETDEAGTDAPPTGARHPAPQPSDDASSEPSSSVNAG